MQIRNGFRMSASQLKEEGIGAVEKNAIRKVAHDLDNQIISTLRDEEPALVTRYQDDLSRWGTRRTYDEAVGKASNKRQGEFNADDWVSGATRYSPRRIKRGDAPLQKEAYSVMDEVNALGEDVPKRRSDVEWEAKIKSDEIKDATKDAVEAAKVQAKNDPVLKQSLENLRAAEDQVKTYQRRMPQMDPPAFQRAYANRSLGSLFRRRMPSEKEMITPNMKGIPMAKVLGTEGTQHFIANETAPQQYIADLLRRWDDSLLKERVHNASYGVARSASMPIMDIGQQ
jgi:hypothetical protein